MGIEFEDWGLQEKESLFKDDQFKIKIMEELRGFINGGQLLLLTLPVIIVADVEPTAALTLQIWN